MESATLSTPPTTLERNSLFRKHKNVLHDPERQEHMDITVPWTMYGATFYGHHEAHIHLILIMLPFYLTSHFEYQLTSLKSHGD